MLYKQHWARTQTGLSQSVTKELVTNELTFSTCESQSQDQDSPVPELSATTITFNPCESQSQDQDSPVPELSATTITFNRTVLHKPVIFVRILFMGPSSPVT